jgi:hypothetical protein
MKRFALWLLAAAFCLPALTASAQTQQTRRSGGRAAYQGETLWRGVPLFVSGRAGDATAISVTVSDLITLDSITTTDLRVTAPSVPEGLTWTIERSTDQSNWTPVATNASGDQSIAGGLTANTTYWFRGRAGSYRTLNSSTNTNPTGTMTLLAREPFTNGYRTYTTNNWGGNFTNGVNFIYGRLVGPRLAGQPMEWSGDCRPTNTSTQPIYGMLPLTMTNTDRILFSGWAYIKSGDMTAGQNSGLFSIFDAFSTPTGFGLVTSNAVLAAKHGSTIYGTVSYPRNTWFWWGLAVKHNSAALYDSRWYIATNGGAPVIFVSVTNATAFRSPSQFVGTQFGMLGGNSANQIMRFGTPSIHRFTSTNFADITIPPDVAIPSGVRNEWYVNPVTGSDTNHGGSPDRAWATATNLVAESRFTGLMPATNWTVGDTVFIDTSASNLVLNGSSVIIRTDGLSIEPFGTNRYIMFETWRTLTNSQFTKTASWTNIYQTTDTGPNAVIWENDKWLTHPEGANFAAVASLMDTNPGSFWTDGTNMFVHPFGSTAPTNDTKVYTRSFGTYGGVIYASSRNFRLRGAHIRKTAVVNPALNLDLIGEYGIGVTTGADGTNMLIADCYVDYSAKHAYGFVYGGVSGTMLTISNCVGEQSAPYGSGSVWVSFMDGGGNPSNNVHRYLNCRTFNGIGAIGSTNGAGGGTEIYSHTTGTPTADPFSRFDFIDCTFSNCAMGGGAVSLVVVSNCIVGSVGFGSTIIERSTVIDDADPLNGATIALNGTNIIRHSIFKPSGLTGTAASPAASGVAVIENCVIDTSRLTLQGGGTNQAVWRVTNSLNFTFRNNVFIATNTVATNTAGVTWALLSQAKSTNTLTFSNNDYWFGSNANRVMHQFHDGTNQSDRTFAQWQALGYDANSITNPPALNASYYPSNGSPVINAGLNVGPAIDYTGTNYATRNDIGAYEVP